MFFFYFLWPLSWESVIKMYPWKLKKEGSFFIYNFAMRERFRDGAERIITHALSVVIPEIHSWTGAYERVAVGTKYLCRSLPRIYFLWELPQSLFHVHLGWNSNMLQSLYLELFWLWPDDNSLAWSGAIHLQKKVKILAVNCQSHQYFAHYLVSKMLS